MDSGQSIRRPRIKEDACYTTAIAGGWTLVVRVCRGWHKRIDIWTSSPEWR